MFQILYYILHTFQAVLVPICFLCAWALVTLFIWSMWVAGRDSVKRAKQMHQVPCVNCQYFTNDYRLKCTVHPSIANTEEAINCLDYQPKTNPLAY